MLANIRGSTHPEYLTCFWYIGHFRSALFVLFLIIIFQWLQHWGEHQHEQVQLDKNHHLHSILYDPELPPDTSRRLGTRFCRSRKRLD
jgi:hypothetical protein